MPFRHLPALLAAGTATLAAAPALAACQRTPVVFDLPAQRLDEAVQQLAHRTGCPVTVDPSSVADRRAPALRGRFTPEQALARLIRNTGYDARSTPEGLAFGGELLSITMSQARVLRTEVRNQARAGRLPAARAARLRAVLTDVERALPRQVNAQGMLTPAQRRDAIRKLDGVGAAVGPVEDARDWPAFRRGEI